MINGKTWRDYHKVLTTKLFYNKTNQVLLNNPALHAKAIYDGLVTEHASRLLEEICKMRYIQTGYQYHKSHDQFILLHNKYTFVDEAGDYACETEINQRCGLSIYNLLIYAESGNPMVNGETSSVYINNNNKTKMNAKMQNK